MSNKFEKVKAYYECRLWDISRLRKAVEKGWITPEEFEEISGQVYAEE